MPLRHLPANAQSNLPGEPPGQSGGEMNTSARGFIRTVGISGASLVLRFDMRGSLFSAAGKNATAAFQPNGWIRIGDDGIINLTIGKSEMGQGVRTTLAMILAEELGADWTRIKLVQAKPSPSSDLGTGGSDSVRSSWKPLRQAGAAAREMLVAADAARWKVDPASCSATRGGIVHTPTARRLEYGSLVVDAAKLSIPANPPLKNPGKFEIVGQRTARIDGPDIVSGKARYGVDVKIPG